MMDMLFGAYAAFSPVILFISVSVVVIVLRHNRNYLNQIYFQLFIIFIITYLFLGTVSLLMDSSYLDDRVNLLILYRKYINAMIIVLVYYIGYRFLSNFYSINYLIKLIVLFTSFSMVFILIGPLIGLNKLYLNATEGIQMVDRATGFFKNPNEAGALSNIMLVLLLTTIELSRRKLIYIILLPITLVATVITLSKAAILTDIFVLIFYMVFSLFRFHKASFIKRFTLIAVMFSLGFSIVYGVNYVWNNFDKLTYSQQRRITSGVMLLSGEINSETTSTRTEVYMLGIERIMQRPLLGYGLGSFHRVKGFGLGIHSTYLMIFGEGGIIAFLTFICFLGFLLKGGYNIHDPTFRFLIVGLFIVISFNILGTNHHTISDRVFNAMLGISLAVLSISNKKR
jgi:O-antigen ligase